jgi:uncharacterized protein YacL
MLILIQGGEPMVKRIVQLFFVIVGGMLGFLYVPNLLQLTQIQSPVWVSSPYTGAIIGAIILFLTTFWLVDYTVNLFKWVEDALIKAPVTDVLFGGLGLVVGLLVAFLIVIPLKTINFQVVNTVIPIFVTFFLGYLGFQVGFKKRDELVNLFPSSSRLSAKDKKKMAEDEAREENRGKMKILDTSVIIDGRIADVSQTGFIEGTIVIPQFVLEELQHIADSSDVLKRNRGRRGLDILNKIRKEQTIKVEIYEGDFEEIHEVDSKLVKLAKLTTGVVVTNDFNLNKVCELQNVPVLNN